DRIDGDVDGEDSERRTVGGRHVVEPVRRRHAARPRHVLRHDRGVAGDMRTQITSEELRIRIVAATRRVSDHQLDDLRLVEVAYLVGSGAERPKLKAAGRGCGGNKGREPPGHAACPPRPALFSLVALSTGGSIARDAASSGGRLASQSLPT